jgi:large subunit ribosomal protein L9
MKIILIKDVEKIGKVGDILQVKDGFGRNLLIPCGLALIANETNLKRLNDMKKKKLKIEEKEKCALIELKQKIEAVSLTITAEVKEHDEIYGSISEVQILRNLQEEGIELTKEKIILSEPIKRLGVYTAKIRLHPEIEAGLRVWVVKK